MSNKPFPLSRETRDQFNLFGPVFQSADITQLYQQAQQLSYKINLHIENPKERISPGKLLSLFVLRLAKQDIINFVNEAAGGNFTKALIKAVDQDPASGTDMVNAYTELYQEDPTAKNDLSTEDIVEEIILLLAENRNQAISRGTVRDLAVSFKRTDKRSGKSVYIYHGNDGTSMPWNDTAQLNFLNPETRETVIEEIIQVAKQFPIIRFDAAMTLAKKHIQRL